MHRESKILKRFFIALNILVAAILFLHINREYKIKEGCDRNHISHFSPNYLKANELASATFDITKLRSLNTIEFLKLNYQELPTIGAIYIPTVEMELPIYNGVSDEHMYFGAGTMRPLQKMGVSNYVIGSRTVTNNVLLFGPLNKIKMKDKIYLTDLERTYIYEVNEIKTAASVIDTEHLEETDEAIVTLVTFNEHSNTHLIVQGTLRQKLTIIDTQQSYLN